MIQLIKRERDRNGNTVARIICADGSFTIQSNGNLPNVHRDFAWDGYGESNKFGEVSQWVRKNGTPRQKRLMGVSS